jgi:aldehyde:ferredoxin oxidoreductase
MVGGYAGKFLEVDLEQEKIKNTVFSEQILRDYLGGRASEPRSSGTDSERTGRTSTP